MPLDASALVVVRVVMLVGMRSLYAMSDCFHSVSQSQMNDRDTSAQSIREGPVTWTY